MNLELQKHLLAQIDDVLAYRDKVREDAKYDDMSGMASWDYEPMIAMAVAAVERVAGLDSSYAKRAREASTSPEGRRGSDRPYLEFRLVFGILESLRMALVGGHLRPVQELIHASLFADFLEMARGLLDQGYRGPAAVLAGSSLESHLRLLCANHNVATVRSTNSGSQFVKADRMNAELAKAKAYSVLDQKGVTAWLDLRNKAAHGDFGAFTDSQAELMLAGIEDLIRRHPA